MGDKVYLGDGAYALFEGFGLGGVTVTAENGIETTDSIYFEPETLRVLVTEWYRRQPRLRAYLLEAMPEENKS